MYELRNNSLDRCNTIHLGELEPPRIDWRRAAALVHMLPGNVAVEMEPPATGTGSIHLPERVAGRLRPDTGVVLAVGGKRGGVDPSRHLTPGDRIALLPYDGKHFREFRCGAYETRNRVRMIGIASNNEHEQAHKPFDEIIVAKIKPERVLQPIRRWALIRRDSEADERGGIELPDAHRYRSQRATVIACGDLCTSVAPGDRIIYQGKALLVDFEFGERYGFIGNPKDYAMIHEADVHAVVRE